MKDESFRYVEANPFVSNVQPFSNGVDSANGKSGVPIHPGIVSLSKSHPSSAQSNSRRTHRRIGCRQRRPRCSYRSTQGTYMKAVVNPHFIGTQVPKSSLFNTIFSPMLLFRFSPTRSPKVQPHFLTSSKAWNPSQLKDMGVGTHHGRVHPGHGVKKFPPTLSNTSISVQRTLPIILVEPERRTWILMNFQIWTLLQSTCVFAQYIIILAVVKLSKEATTHFDGPPEQKVSKVPFSI